MLICLDHSKQKTQIECDNSTRDGFLQSEKRCETRDGPWLLPIRDQTRLLLYFTIPELLMSLVHTRWINNKVAPEQPSLKVTK
jgi:hypothetical protein